MTARSFENDRTTEPMPRGIGLERAFADWMRRSLGYTRTTLRVPVKGAVADRAYEVDIHAEKFSPLWDGAWRLGLFVAGLAFLSYLLPAELQSVRQFMEHVIRRIDPNLVGHSLLLFGIGAAAIGILGKKRATTHAWVECKDTKSNVKRAQVQKLAAAVQDVRDNEGAKWHPSVVILVASAGFDTDALNFAEEHGFLTYRRVGSAFEEVD